MSTGRQDMKPTQREVCNSSLTHVELAGPLSEVPSCHEANKVHTASQHAFEGGNTLQQLCNNPPEGSAKDWMEAFWTQVRQTCLQAVQAEDVCEALFSFALQET